jgi:iron complex transport system substrate-binding protein
MRRFLFLLLVIAFCLSAPKVEGKTIVFKDKLGRIIKIDVPVKRAVILSGYEILPALKCQDRIVGISRWAFKEEFLRSWLRKAKKDIVPMGTASDVNMEMLIKMKPDVVTIWTSKPELIKFMEERGLKVIGIYPESLRDLYETMDLFGKLFNEERKIKEVERRMEEIFNLIKSKTRDIPVRSRKKVLWLWGSPTRVAGGKSLEGSVLELMNVVNPASHYKATGVDVSMERIMKWNPDVIFIWGSAKYDVEDILNNPQWKTINAVRRGKVFKAPNWSTWSPRLALIALWMAEKTYPERFPSSTVSKICADFYEKVFGMSDGELKNLLK